MDGSSSLKVFLGMTEESISERESIKFEEGLNLIRVSTWGWRGHVIHFKGLQTHKL